MASVNGAEETPNFREMPEFVVVFTSCPDKEVAGRIARQVVERRLAACAHVQGPGESVYRWQGAVETASEYLVQIKTSVGLLPALKQVVSSLHPYQVPEFIAVPIVDATVDYMEWLSANVGELSDKLGAHESGEGLG